MTAAATTTRKLFRVTITFLLASGSGSVL